MEENQTEQSDRWSSIKEGCSLLRSYRARRDTDIAGNERLRSFKLTRDEAIKAGIIEASDLWLPKRVIDQQITLTAGPFIEYLEGSERHVVIISHTAEPFTALESAYTRYVRTEDWQTPFYQVRECAAIHGYGFIEAVRDDRAPDDHSIKFEFVRPEDMAFSDTTVDIQDEPVVMRRYKLKQHQMEDFKNRYQWAPDVYDKFINTSKNDIFYEYVVYKVFVMASGQLECCWVTDEIEKLTELAPYSLVTYQSNDLTVLIPNGIEGYPFFVYRYKLDTKTPLQDCTGLAHDYSPEQDSQTHLQSAVVSGVRRSAHLYGSRKKINTEANAPLAYETIQIKPGQVFNDAVDFFNFPSPTSDLLSVLGYINSHTMQQSGNVDFMAASRRGERTAAEINLATSLKGSINTVGLGSWSRFLLNAFVYQWKVITENIRQGTCRLNIGEDLMRLGMSGYSIVPSGSVDYLARKQIVAALQPIMQYFGNQPKYGVVMEHLLAYYIKIVLPQQSDALVNSLNGGIHMMDLMKRLTTDIGLLISQLDPETQVTALTKLKPILQEVEFLLGQQTTQ